MYVFVRDVRIHTAYDYASSLREFVCESPLFRYSRDAGDPRNRRCANRVFVAITLFVRARV